MPGTAPRIQADSNWEASRPRGPASRSGFSYSLGFCIHLGVKAFGVSFRLDQEVPSKQTPTLSFESIWGFIGGWGVPICLSLFETSPLTFCEVCCHFFARPPIRVHSLACPAPRCHSTRLPRISRLLCVNGCLLQGWTAQSVFGFPIGFPHKH